MIWESVSIERTYPPRKSRNRLSHSEDSSRERWLSIRILYITCFISAIGYSIIITSIWPFLKLLNPYTSTTFLGFAVGIFSFGQCVASPLLGWLSTRFNNTVLSLYVGLILQLVGNLMWANLQDFPHGEYFLLVARAIIGCGAGISACVRAYMSKATTIEERTNVAGEFNAFKALGFCLGPAVQAACVFAGYPGPIEVKGLHFNMYTSPAWISAVLIVVNMIVLKIKFREHEVEDFTKVPTPVYDQSGDMQEEHQESVEVEVKQESRVDIQAVLLLLFLNFIASTSYITMETLATPLAVFELGWAKTFAMMVTGGIWTGVGLVTIGLIFLIFWLTKRVDEKKLMAGGYFFIFVGFIITLPISGPTPPIQWMNNTSYEIEDQNSPGGCPSILSWCFTEPRITLAQIIVATFVLTVGFTFNNVLCYSLFSKSLVNMKQGLWMGIYTADGGLARLLVPIYVGSMLRFYGPLITLGSVAALTLPGLAWMMFIYDRLGQSPASATFPTYQKP